MQTWNWSEKNGIRIITMDNWLQQGINMAFSTRHGGLSSGIYDSLNMGLHVGDQKKLVQENRRRYMQMFSTTLEDVVCCQQVHGCRVISVNAGDRGKGAMEWANSIPGCDAMITDTPGVYLMSFYADCLPVYFYDPVKRAIGLAHSGWKGTMGKIVIKTLKAMQTRFSSRVGDILVFIGPGIGSCCFEILPDLAGKVDAEFSHLHDIINYSNNGVITWDLQETNRQMLQQAGIEPHNICVCSICTACNTGNFYSYRMEKGETGRMAAVLGIEY